MRSLLGSLLVHIMALLLAGSSPIGTGQGAHQGLLLDALVPHVHFASGQRVEPRVAEPVATDDSLRTGPAFGAGAGAASAASAGLAWAPAIPIGAIVLPAAPDLGRLEGLETSMPVGRAEAPPEPPPDTLS